MAEYNAIQQGLWTGVVKVLQNPILQKVIGTVIDSTLLQRGIKPPVENPNPKAPSPFIGQHGIFSSIGSLL
ncbi:hypothetical protein H0H81_010248, partial [Sphagnurus paluster]